MPLAALTRTPQQKPEFQPHLGIALYPAYSGKRSAEFQFSAWENLALTTRTDLTTDLLTMRLLFPPAIQSNIIDVQIIGSQAYGTATVGSDIDILFVVPSLTADAMRQKGMTPNRYQQCPDVAAKMSELSQRYGVQLEWSIGLDARGLICFSLTDQKLYGRVSGQPSMVRVKYNFLSKAYELVAYKPHTFLG